MKKHEVIIDMTDNFFVFWPSHYIHIGVIFLINPFSLSMETTTIKIEKDITSQKMIKMGSKEDMTNFL